MKTFVDQRKAKPVFRRYVPVVRVDQAGRARTLRREQIRQILDTPRPQFKLTIGAPDELYEQEANRVGDAVLRMPDPRAEEQQVQRMCTECEEEMVSRQAVEQTEEDEEAVPAKGAVGGAPTVTSKVEAGIQSLRGQGRPLEEPTRRFFDPRFERDFSDVRVHTDDRAGDTAVAINARAYTIGNDVVFGRGEYSPGTTEGQRLLAHELTHVVQQGKGNNAQRKLGVSRAPAAEIRRAITSTINGVTMEKASSVSDSSLKSVVTDQLDAVISSTMDGVALDAIYVSSANDGTHGEDSRHYSNLAVDMSRVKTAGATDWQKMSVHYPGTENVKKVVKALQNGFEDQVGTPGVRENFGPYIKKKNGADWTVGGHGDHIHISCNE